MLKTEPLSAQTYGHCSAVNLGIKLGPHLTGNYRKWSRLCPPYQHMCNGLWTGVGAAKHHPGRKLLSYCRGEEKPMTQTLIRLCSLDRWSVTFINAVTVDLFDHFDCQLKIKSVFQQKLTEKCLSFCSPGCVDPDNVQVTEIMALIVVLDVAGTAPGPHMVWWGSITYINIWLLHDWKTQTYRNKRNAP